MKMQKLAFAAMIAAISLTGTTASAACSFSGSPTQISTFEWDSYSTLHSYNDSHFTFCRMLKPDPLNTLIQTRTMDGAPAQKIVRFERKIIPVAMTLGMPLEVLGFEPRYEPPTPEQVAGLIWRAYSNGDIPIESIDGLIEEYWRKVETEKRQARQRDEALVTN